MSEVLEQHGPYTRVRRLGVGGMAETFLAVQRGAAGFEQRVCMKFILPAHRENPDFKRLFLREASIAASLRHSNIVGVIDVDDAAAYLVLELVDGVDLRALINAAPSRRLPENIATLIAIELCKALAYAHGRKRGGLPDGIVHRDVSASNVLISYSGEVKLTDFGVARAMRSDAEPLSTTVKGKLCYMSPEQARGLVLDGRSDLFSLGVLFYELLSGQRPFDGATDADTLLRITAGQHTPLLELAPDVPAGIAEVVERLLARDRDQRFASADACIDALTAFAPKATTFRALGDFARATRPHQTLPSYEVLSLDRTVPSQPGRQTLTETRILPDQLPAPRTSPGLGSAAVRSAATFSATGFAHALRQVHGNAWTALGVSLLLLLAVASTWAARIASEPQDGLAAAPGAAASSSQNVQRGTAPPERQLVPGATPTSASIASTRGPQVQSGAAVNVSALHAPVEGPAATATSVARATDVPSSARARDIATNAAASSPASPPALPEEGAAAQSPNKRPPSAASRSRTASSEEGEATLHIGVVPVGQVWIDGHAVGWTPVETKLSAGMHSIAAGATRPEVKRYLRIRAGEDRQLVLSLDADSHSADAQGEATSSPIDR